MSDTDELAEFQDKLGDGKLVDVQRNKPSQSSESPAPPDRGVIETYSDDVQWAIRGNSIYTAVGETRKTLPSAVYSIEIDGRTGQYLFRARNIITDDLIVLPDTASSRVLAAVDTFWAAREKFKEFGQIYKRGVLLFGPAGSGKTSTLNLLTRDLVQRNGIVILGGHPGRTTTGLDIVRRVEPDRPIICVLEDIDEIIREHGEHELLALLDGETQIANILFLASTNYPERLDKRFINRPSRFDEIIKVGMPSEVARQVYLESRLGSEFKDIGQWVKDTKDFSVAHLRELVVAVYCLDRSYTETVDRLRRMSYTPKSEGGAGAGFFPHAQE